MVGNCEKEKLKMSDVMDDGCVSMREVMKENKSFDSHSSVYLFSGVVDGKNNAHGKGVATLVRNTHRPKLERGPFFGIVHPNKPETLNNYVDTSTSEKLKQDNDFYLLRGWISPNTEGMKMDRTVEYVGDFRNDQRHGKGELKCANGDRYVGQFAHGQRCGSGQYFFADGIRVLYCDNWSGGFPQNPCTMYFGDKQWMKCGFSTTETVNHLQPIVFGFVLHSDEKTTVVRTHSLSFAGVNSLTLPATWGFFLDMKREFFRRTLFSPSPQHLFQRDTQSIRGGLKTPSGSVEASVPPRDYTQKDYSTGMKWILRLQHKYRARKQRKKNKKEMARMLDRIAQRSAILEELQMNENSHMEGLHLMAKHYVAPLRKVMDKKESERLFANFEEILAVEQELNSEMKDKKGVKVIEALSKVIPKMKCVIGMTANFALAVGLWKKIELEMKELKEAAKDKSKENIPPQPREVLIREITDIVAKAKENAPSIDMQNFLLRPFTKLIHYQNALSDIVKRTPKMSAEFVTCERVQREIIALLNYVNKEVRAIEIERKMREKDLLSEKEKMMKMLKQKKEMFFSADGSLNWSVAEVVLLSQMILVASDKDFKEVRTYKLLTLLSFVDEPSEEVLTLNFLASNEKSRCLKLCFKRVKEAGENEVVPLPEAERKEWKDEITKACDELEGECQRSVGVSGATQVAKKVESIFKEMEAVEKDIETDKEKIDQILKETKTILERATKYKMVMIRNTSMEMREDYRHIIELSKRVNSLRGEIVDLATKRVGILSEAFPFYMKFLECCGNETISFNSVFQDEFAKAMIEFDKLKSIAFPVESFEKEQVELDVHSSFGAELERDDSSIELLVEKDKILTQRFEGLRAIEARMSFLLDLWKTVFGTDFDSPVTSKVKVADEEVVKSFKSLVEMKLESAELSKEIEEATKAIEAGDEDEEERELKKQLALAQEELRFCETRVKSVKEFIETEAKREVAEEDTIKHLEETATALLRDIAMERGRRRGKKA